MEESGQSGSELSRADVEEIVQKALEDVSGPGAGLTAEDVERISRRVVASIPHKALPDEYTKFVVDNAISRYEAEGLETTLAYYNREDSIDGQWYVFIIDQNDVVIGHSDPERLGLDLKGWVGTDANGYNFGADMLTATGDGRWVSYVYRNPEKGPLGFGAFELKSVWVVRHDGLLFASGWYIDADEFTTELVSVAVDKFRTGGLEATISYFASPNNELAGLESAIGYYNSAETIEGTWSAFIADEGGKIVAHSNPAEIGGDLNDLFGNTALDITEGGSWVVTEALRMRVAGYGGYVFGSGWRHGESDN